MAMHRENGLREAQIAASFSLSSLRLSLASGYVHRLK
jgi:hypothetical protein